MFKHIKHKITLIVPNHDCIMLQVTVTLDKSDEFDVIENKTGHVTFKSIEVVNNVQVTNEQCNNS